MGMIWLLLFAILIFVEAATFNLITIWFAVGALIAFVSTYFINNAVTQIFIFAVVTTTTLILTKPLVNKLVKGRGHIKTNLDSAIGACGIVEAEIKPNTIGRVTVLGKDWAAKGEKKIKVGSKVEILAIEGVKLIVKEIEEE